MLVISECKGRKGGRGGRGGEEGVRRVRGADRERRWGVKKNKNIYIKREERKI